MDYPRTIITIIATIPSVMLAIIAPLSTLLATLLAPVITDIGNFITRLIIRVGILAPLAPEGIVIRAYLAIHTITFDMPRAFGIIEVIAPLTIDTAIRA
jgi:hypothetical protein